MCTINKIHNCYAIERVAQFTELHVESPAKTNETDINTVTNNMLYNLHTCGLYFCSKIYVSSSARINYNQDHDVPFFKLNTHPT